jgi:D-alanine-D-alanine ligase
VNDADPVIAVFLGGISAEREVSLGSGAAAAAALARSFSVVETYDIGGPVVPAAVGAGTHVVFSTLHGVFGEDGGMQTLLERRGVEYAGCDARASALCFNKQRTKDAVSAAGVPVAKGVLVRGEDVSLAAALVGDLGQHLVVKPNCSGSSVGLSVVEGAEAIATAIATAGAEGFIVEQRVFGREVTVGVLDGEAMGVVEIRPRSGRFDYTSKYTKGLTEYLAPAPFDPDVTGELQRHAATAFRACACRDYARVDFMVTTDGRPVLLEVNTLPGLKETSLLPMSASCLGLDFVALVRRMTLPAIARLRARATAAPVAISSSSLRP